MAKHFYFTLLCAIALLSCGKKEYFSFYLTSNFHRLVWDAEKKDIFLLKSLRDSQAAGKIFMDAGGSFSIDHLENRHTLGKETASVMAEFGHDAVIIDSETLKLSPKELENVAARLSGKALSSNLYWKNGRTPETIKRNLLLTSGGIKIGIISVIINNPEKPDKSSYRNGYKIENPVYEINRNMEKIRKNSNLKILFLNFAFGEVKELKKSLDIIFPLLSVKPDIAIMSGPTWFHHFKHRNVWVIPSRTKISEVLRVDISVNSNLIKKDLEIVPIKPLELKGEPSGGSFIEKISDIRNRSSAYFDRVISRTPVDLETEKDGYSPLGDIMADSLKNYIRSNGAIISRSSLKKGLSAGDIKVRDIYELLAPDDNLTYTKVRGLDVPKLAARIYGRKISVSGIRIHYKGKEPVKVLISGRPLNNREVYRFLIPQSLINDDCSILSHSTEFSVLPRTTLDAAMWYFRTRKIQAPKGERRITEE